RLAVTDPEQTVALAERALVSAGSISDLDMRDRALVSIAEQLATAASANPALRKPILNLAKVTSMTNQKHRRTLVDIIEHQNQAACADPEQIDFDQETPGEEERTRASLRKLVRTRNGLLDELSHWRLRPLNETLNLVSMFLENCHAKATAEKIGLAILH